MDNLLYKLGWNIMYAYYLNDKERKTCIITDDLDKNSGYITFYMIKHYSDKYDKSMFNLDMSDECKEKKIEDLHNTVQDIIGLIVDEIKTNLIKKEYYQSELARRLGTKYLEDNDWIVYTILQMCINQGIITSYIKNNNRKYFKILEDKNYKKLTYIERKKDISIGESAIEMILKEKQINYIREHTFQDLKYKSKLRYDFYLIDFKVLLEYDGKQHYEKIDYFHKTIKDFEESQKRDELKTLYAEQNNYKLFRIKYNEDIFERMKYIIQML